MKSFYEAKKKNMCDDYCMEILNRVGRAEKVLILKKRFYMGITGKLYGRTGKSPKNT